MLCPSVSAGTASCTQTSIRSLLARAEPGTLQRLARGRGTVRCYEAGNACRGFVARGLGWSLGSGWFKGSCLGGGGVVSIPVMYKVKVSAPQDVGW